MDRLGTVSRHLRAAGRAPAAAAAAAAAKPPVASAPKLLTDAQVREFIVNGVLTLPVADVAQDVHDRIHAEAERLFDKNISLGNDIYPGLAGLDVVMESATVDGALTSLLGRDYALHPHRAFHNSTTQGEQTFHKDTQRGKVKGFRPRWVMALYVPAGCTVEMGPTAVVPQSHYLCNDGVGLSYLEGKDAKWCHLSDPSRANDPTALAPFLREEKCTAPLRVGSVTLMHFDMMHRGTARAVQEHLESSPFRPMFKLQFLRTVDPGLTPSWDHDPTAEAVLPSFDDLAGPLAPACQSVWEWMLGNKSPERVASLTDDAVAFLERGLALAGPDNEAARVSAAVQLARAGWIGDGRSHEPLLQALANETCEERMRAAMHALGCAGDAAVPALIYTLVTLRPPLVAGRAAEALGEAAATPTPTAIAALCELAARMESDIKAAPPTIDWGLPSKGGGSNFLLETFQLPLLPIEQREAAARWLTIKSCVDSLGIFGQRAVARGDGKLCLSLAQTLVGFLSSECPPVRHAAAIGLTCVVAIPEVRSVAEALLPPLLTASHDRSAVMDHNARAPATDALMRLLGGGRGARGNQRAASMLEGLVTARFTA